MKITTRLIAMAVAAPLALASCSGDKPAENTAANATNSSSVSSEPKPGETVDAKAFLEKTSAASNAKKTYRMSMTMASTTSQTAEITGEGVVDMSAPDVPKAKLTMNASGRKTEIVLLGQDVYLTSPSAPDKYVKLTTQDVAKQLGGMGLDQMFNPVTAMEKAISSVEKVTFVGKERDLNHYTVELDMAKALAPGTSLPTSAPKKLTHELYLDSDNLMRQTDLEVSGVKVLMKADKWGEPVTITAPAPDTIVPMPSR